MNNREKEQVATYPNVMTENDDIASTSVPRQVREQLACYWKTKFIVF